MTGLTAGALDFNLRAWTTHSVSWVVVRSNLAVAVREGLAQAGIEAPRPQSDLHLRGLSAEFAQALAGREPKPSS